MRKKKMISTADMRGPHRSSGEEMPWIQATPSMEVESGQGPGVEGDKKANQLFQIRNGECEKDT